MEKPFEESWFFAPLNEVGDRFTLPKEEAFHMRKVLRLLPGRQVIASNGKGSAFLCDTLITKGENLDLVSLELVAKEMQPPILNLVLSLLKGKDLEEPTEGLCQLNVKAIHLVTTDHTQEFKGQNHDRLVERLRGKSLVALKQAKKLWLTEIFEPMPLIDWNKKHSAMPLVLLHPGKDKMPMRLEEEFGVLSGPEGGFSQSELEWLVAKACYRLELGPTRIRGTHAPLIACGKLMGLGLI